MRRKRFSEVQVIRVLKESESGNSVEELCQEYNVARSTIYMWCTKYGGIDRPCSRNSKKRMCD
jgi:putative transposase